MILEGQPLMDYMYFMIFLFFGAVTALFSVLVPQLLAPGRRIGGKHTASYECGMDPYGKAWNFRFGVAYYLYALIFLAFDVDILFLYPVATAFNKVSAVRGLLELIIFIGILCLAIIYAWVKGVFNWQKRNSCSL